MAEPPQVVDRNPRNHSFGEPQFAPCQQVVRVLATGEVVRCNLPRRVHARVRRPTQLPVPRDGP